MKNQQHAGIQTTLLNGSLGISKQGSKRLQLNCLLLLFMATVCLISGKLFLPQRPIFLFSHAAFVVTSGSMAPKYPINSVVIIRKGDFNSVRVGDVIAFKSLALADGIAFHRVVRRESGKLYTKGDNNYAEDSQAVTKESFVGVEVASINIFATYLSNIQTNYGFVLYFILPIFGIACFFYARVLYQEQ